MHGVSRQNSLIRTQKTFDHSYQRQMDKFHFLCTMLPCLILLFLHLLCPANAALNNIATVPFGKGFSPLWGEPNIKRSADDKTVQLHLNQNTGMLAIFHLVLLNFDQVLLSFEQAEKEEKKLVRK